MMNLRCATQLTGRQFSKHSGNSGPKPSDYPRDIEFLWSLYNKAIYFRIIVVLTLIKNRMVEKQRLTVLLSDIKCF